MESPRTFSYGAFIDDRYRVLRSHQGGMGKVYIASDIVTDQTVAIKTVDSDNVDFSRAFLSEAQTWILLEKHPYIAQAKSSFIVNNQPFLVVEYIEGGDLRKRIDIGDLTIDQALRLGIEFCSGADYAYRKLGLVHRDIKPDNLLLTPRGRLKIADFGLARAGGSHREKGVIAGTPKYMPPEQWMDGENVTKQSDIYSFGIVIYEMLTGRTPFEEEKSIASICKAHMDEIPQAPRELNPEIPEHLSELVLRCLEKNPIRRPSHYEDLADRFNEISKNYSATDHKDTIDDRSKTIEFTAHDLLNTGDALFALGQYSDAVGYYERLISADPDSAKFWRRKAEALAQLERFNEAELFFMKAVSMEPSSVESVVGAIKCFIKLQKYDDALKYCNPALETNPMNKELLRLKQLLLAPLPEQGEESTFYPTTTEPMATTGASVLSGPEDLVAPEHPLTVSFSNTIMRAVHSIRDDRDLPDATFILDNSIHLT